MQCSQPPYGGSFYNCSPPIQCGGQYPEIIGEGDVTSLTLPDGTIQFLFTPSVKWWEPCQYHPSIANFNCKCPMNCNQYTNTNTRAWYIRSITNQIPTSGYNPQNQRYEHQIPYYVPDCNINGLPIKFHNDQHTSTTDIYYFYPTLRQYEYYGRTSLRCAAVQVDMPVNNNIHFVCSKPCHCAARCESKMSIVENNSNEHLNCSSCKENGQFERNCRCSLRKNRTASKTKSRVVCECGKGSNSYADKSVTTYADKASDCAPKSGCVTQTTSEEADTIETEQWQPRTAFSRKQTKNISLIKITGQSTSCSSNCSCFTDTD